MIGTFWFVLFNAKCINRYLAMSNGISSVHIHSQDVPYTIVHSEVYSLVKGISWLTNRSL